MVIAFANNQSMEADDTTNTIYTDPVPLGNNDRASPISNVHYIYGGATNDLVYTPEVSNDGVNWVSLTGSAVTASSTGVESGGVQAVNGAFLRYKFAFRSGSGAAGAICFDLHVRLDHS